MVGWQNKGGGGLRHGDGRRIVWWLWVVWRWANKKAPLRGLCYYSIWAIFLANAIIRKVLRLLVWHDLLLRHGTHTNKLDMPPPTYKEGDSPRYNPHNCGLSTTARKETLSGYHRTPPWWHTPSGIAMIPQLGGMQYRLRQNILSIQYSRKDVAKYG